MTGSALDTELADLAPEARWREWMGRVEAVIFASPEPVPRSLLAGLVGRDCNLDLLLADIRAELADRPYDLVGVAGGYHHRTRPRFAAAIRAGGAAPRPRPALTGQDATVLMAIAYLQPLTRAELAAVLGREVGREVLERLRGQDLIAPGPRSPQAGAPYTYVTTPAFLARFGLASLGELPEIDALAAAGLLDRPVGRGGLPLAADESA